MTVKGKFEWMSCWVFQEYDVVVASGGLISAPFCSWEDYELARFVEGLDEF